MGEPDCEMCALAGLRTCDECGNPSELDICEYCAPSD